MRPEREREREGEGERDQAKAWVKGRENTTEHNCPVPTGVAGHSGTCELEGSPRQQNLLW